MQEEIEQKSFNLMISTTKLSARTVLRAIKAALRLYQSKTSQGKQSVRALLRQNRGVWEEKNRSETETLPVLQPPDTQADSKEVRQAAVLLCGVEF